MLKHEGKILERKDKTFLEIAGIIEGWPEQTHLKFDFIASLKNVGRLERRKEQWNSASVLIYCLLQPNCESVTSFTRRIKN